MHRALVGGARVVDGHRVPQPRRRQVVPHALGVGAGDGVDDGGVEAAQRAVLLHERGEVVAGGAGRAFAHGKVQVGALEREHVAAGVAGAEAQAERGGDVVAHARRGGGRQSDERGGGEGGTDLAQGAVVAPEVVAPEEKEGGEGAHGVERAPSLPPLLPSLPFPSPPTIQTRSALHPPRRGTAAHPPATPAGAAQTPSPVRA